MNDRQKIREELARRHDVVAGNQASPFNVGQVDAYWGMIRFIDALGDAAPPTPAPEPIDLLRPIWEVATGSKPHTFAVFRASLGAGVDIHGPGGVVEFYDTSQAGGPRAGIPIEGLNAMIPDGTHVNDVPIEAIQHIFYSLLYMRVVVVPDARGVRIVTSDADGDAP